MIIDYRDDPDFIPINEWLAEKFFVPIVGTRGDGILFNLGHAKIIGQLLTSSAKNIAEINHPSTIITPKVFESIYLITLKIYTLLEFGDFYRFRGYPPGSILTSLPTSSVESFLKR
jgi:hypothetical protein